MSIFGKVLEGLTGPVATYFTRRAELSAAKHAANIAAEVAKGERMAKLLSEGLAADASWEMEFARQAGNSWKDEYTLLVVSIPLVMAFVPGLSKYVSAGFEAFGSTPVWYQIMVQSIFYATYGMRLWRRQQSDT